METYSKALNAAQYPLSVLAVTAEAAAAIYKRGLYGNTMTANPRALDVACAVLAQLTPPCARTSSSAASRPGHARALKAELEGRITKVQGTGLLFSCELAPGYKGYGAGSTEEWMREHGIGVIHGGENSLRFTPHFAVTEDELKLVVATVKRALLEGPRQQVDAAA
jgi:acetylornithine/succinyldiaminopimelate/putrescine aminotransferase